ncbi:MAG: hypothetical protein LBT86_03570 [Deltaproteobacteria bacterium]|jgi:hypothetical protein|nr:hypothetical protein [Deltaproteobacteria bacterium]
MEASNSRLKVIFVSAAILTAVTYVFFWASVNSPSGGQFLALVFLLIAEMVTFFSLSVAQADLLGARPSFFRLGTFSAVSVYFLLSLVVATGYIIFDPDKQGLLIGLEVLLLGLFAALEFGLWMAGRKAGQPSSQTRRGQESSQALIGRLSTIKDLWPQSPERVKLEKILDEVRYFNHNVEVDVDSDIAEKVDELDKVATLSQNFSPEVHRLLDELTLLTKKRGQEAIDARRGRV